MRIFTRAWRFLFDHSEIPSNAPAGLDDSRARAAAFSVLVPFPVTYVVYLISKLALSGLDSELSSLIGALTCFAAFFGSMVWAFWFTHKRVKARFLAIRESAEAPALAAGYGFHDTFPPPLPSTSEAVFYRWRYALIPQRLTHAITGTFSDYHFTAGHLEGVEVSRTARQTSRSPYSENIVMVKLPGLLPELKLRDRGASTPRDYGITLQSAPSGDPAVDARWDIQSHYPALAHQMLTPEMRAYLVTVPFVPCTMVIRNGYLISCRDPLGDFESISQRLAILVGFIERIPAEFWQRETTAIEGGAGRAVEPAIRVTTWPILRR